jgi:hypothetical protein
MFLESEDSVQRLPRTSLSWHVSKFATAFDNLLTPTKRHPLELRAREVLMGMRALFGAETIPQLDLLAAVELVC